MPASQHQNPEIRHRDRPGRQEAADHGHRAREARHRAGESRALRPLQGQGVDGLHQVAAGQAERQADPGHRRSRRRRRARARPRRRSASPTRSTISARRRCCACASPRSARRFGMKGGAAGGGYAQVVPMEDINLHFTGDFHAISSAHNLLSALIDNHIYWGNALGIDGRRVAWRRVHRHERPRAARDRLVARRRRQRLPARGRLRHHGRLRGDGDLLPRQATSRTSRSGSATSSSPTRATASRCARATSRRTAPMTVLLKDALSPNLVQTLEGTPAFIHGGPFANIAHGCNSVLATTTALKLADYVVTEAGFGADLGGEKFIDIKCRKTGLAARLRGAGRDHPRAQDAWRREEGRPQEREPEGARSRHGQPAAPCRERAEVRHLVPVVSINRFSRRHRCRDRAGQGRRAPSSASRR